MTAVNLEAIAPKPQPILREHATAGKEPPEAAYVGHRNVYHKNEWTPFNIYEMAELLPGNDIPGPAIIRDPMTTVVIPPDHTMSLDSKRVLHYRKN